MPSRDALERIWQEVALARDDASPVYAFGDREIRRYQSQLWWLNPWPDNTETTVAARLATPLALPVSRDIWLVHGGELRRPRGRIRRYSV